MGKRALGTLKRAGAAILAHQKVVVTAVVLGLTTVASATPTPPTLPADFDLQNIIDATVGANATLALGSAAIVIGLAVVGGALSAFRGGMRARAKGR